MGRSRRKKNILGRLVLLLFIAVLLSIPYSNMALTTSRYTVSSDKLPESFDGFRIVQLSDLHSMEFGSGNSRLLKRIAAEQPDIIVMTGDMINARDNDFSSFFELCRSAADICPTYYVIGNHEDSKQGDQRTELMTGISEAGVIILDNTSVRLEREEQHITLYGFHSGQWSYSGRTLTDDASPVMDGFDAGDLHRALGTPDADGYSVLLAHSPDFFPVYADWGANLTLSGHIHGGMLRLPFVGGVFSPGSHLFPTYDAGEYEIGDSALILSRGLGIGQLGIRVFNPPDVVSVTLRRS